MRKEGSARGKEMPPKAAKPAVLSAEAAAMEQKLADLKKAMEKERAKREALMANAGGGPIWRNGSTNGGLRTGVKGKGPGEGSTSGGTTASASSSGRRPGSSEAATGQGGAATSGAAAPRASSARGAGGSPESEMPSVSGSRLASGRPGAISSDTKGSAIGGGGGGRSSAGGGGSAVGGMSCGTDDNNTLADGAFNEADSHRSFLEALNEWRRANRGDTAADGGGQVATSSTSPSGGRGPQRPRSATQSASLEVQTDSQPASRPSSAKPLSYFDKLVINASSRVAGHLASGGPPESARASLSGQATGLPRPTSATRASTATPPSAPPTDAVPAKATRTPASTGTSTMPAVAATAPNGGSDVSSSSSSSGGGGGKADASDPLSILDRLEALERQRQAADHGADEEEDEVAAAFRVTTSTGVVLTKGARLPDEVLLPPNEGC